MQDQLLSTKFFIPPAHSALITRLRLIKLLQNSLRMPLTIISAPPGFGKTTVLAAWVAGLREEFGEPSIQLLNGRSEAISRHAIGWLSLDADDNGLNRFWIYVIAALRKAFESELRDSIASPSLIEVQGLLDNSPPPYQTFLTLLINDISCLPLSVVLILDDYHVIQDPMISESLVFLVDHCPANLHLVISSRTDPPFPLGRWRIRDQLNNLRAQDLRFTSTEALAFFNDSMGLSLSPENVEELEQRTEGWIAGLKMAAFALQDKNEADVTHTIEAFSGRHHLLLDYFTDEILQRQSKEVQFFLQQTSILDRMCADLCAAVISGEDNAEGITQTSAQAQRMLEYLERANLFVVPLDTERRWYRYHHLFNDLLLTRLRQTSGQVGEVNLRRKAAHWYARQSHLSEAVHQAMLAQDYDLAANFIESPAQTIRIFETGEVATILKWTQELPPDVIHKHHWLKLHQSRSLFYTGKTDAAEAILLEIEQEVRLLPDQIPQSEVLLGMVLSLKARFASVRGKVSESREIAFEALKQIPPTEIGARSFVFPTLGLSAYRMGDVEEAAQLFTETAKITRQAGSRFQTTGNLTNLAITWGSQGKLREVIRLTREAIQEGIIQTISLPESGWLSFPLAEALYEQNELEESERTIIEGLRLIHEGNLTDYFGLMPSLLARIQFALGREEEAQVTMEAALTSARRTTVDYYVSEIEAFQAREWVEKGELVKASSWAEKFRGQPKNECLREIEAITLAEVLLASGLANEARDMLLPMSEDAQARNRKGREIPIRAIMALAFRALGDEQDAKLQLEQALLLGEPESYLRPFLHLGAPMADFLRELAEEKEARRVRDNRGRGDYIRKILTSYPGNKFSTSRRKSKQHSQLIESLTPREMDVLSLLNEGLSNREIAIRLYLSPNTLRVYTTNLYAKLDVHNRTQAVIRASALGII